MAATCNNIFSLQEFLKDPLLTIPKQYLQDQETATWLTKPPPLNIPTIDLDRLISKDTMDLELQKIHSTCKEWGFFLLVNHGVSSSLLEELKHEIQEFYKLPVEEKMKYRILDGGVEGYGTMTRFGEMNMDWGDRFYMVTNPIHSRKEHLFPHLPPSFRDTLESYLKEMQKLSMRILGFMAMALEIDVREIQEKFEDGMQSMRMTYYAPCPTPELVVGLTPHSDATGITILNQVNGVDGLEIVKDGVWSPVSISPNSFVVNVGDILEIMSNGVYKSIEHRSVVNSEGERVSLAFFINPRWEAEVCPSKSILANSQKPPIFKSKTMEACFNDFFSHKLNGKKFVDDMKIDPVENN